MPSLLPANFKGGQAFKVTNVWREIMDYNRSKGVPPPNQIEYTILNQGIDLLHRTYIDPRKPVVFNGKRYPDLASLQSDRPLGQNYQSFNRETWSYIGPLFSELEEKCIIRKLTLAEQSNALYSPLGIADQTEGEGPEKKRLTYHWVRNSQYIKGPVELANISASGEALAHIAAAYIMDLKRYYWQLPLSYSSQLSCGFAVRRPDGGIEHYCWLVLPFGCSGGLGSFFYFILYIFNLFAVFSFPTPFPIPAVKIAQDIATIISTHTQIKYKRFTMQFIDDHLVEKRLCPDDINPSRVIYEKLGLYISEDKCISGTEVTYLGFIINFTRRDIRICQKTLDKTFKKLTALYTLKEQVGLFIHVNVLEALLGSLNFLSQCTILGRTKLYHLKSMFKTAIHDGGQDLLLNSAAYSEILYWKGYVENPLTLPLNRAAPLYSVIENDWSDASLHRWAYKTFRDGQVFTQSGDFPVSVREKGIFEKEAYALYELIKSLPPNSHHVLRCDNQSLVRSYKKGTTKNLYVNTLITSMFNELQLKNTFAEILWVDTFTMNKEGADSLSRGDTSELFDPFSLTMRGANFLKSIYGSIDYDIFGSYRNNPFDTFYHTNHRILDDPQCLAGDGLQRLGLGLYAGKKNFIFPPPSLATIVIDLLSQSFITNATGVLLIFQSQHDSRIRSLFQDRPNFSSFCLQIAGKPSSHVGVKLRHHDLVVYSYGEIFPKFEKQALPIENHMVSGGKRPRLCF